MFWRVVLDPNLTIVTTQKKEASFGFIKIQLTYVYYRYNSNLISDATVLRRFLVLNVIYFETYAKEGQMQNSFAKTETQNLLLAMSATSNYASEFNDSVIL